MKVREMIDQLNKMPEEAELCIFLNYGQCNESIEEVVSVRLLEPDPDNVDLVEINYDKSV